MGGTQKSKSQGKVKKHAAKSTTQKDRGKGKKYVN